MNFDYEYTWSYMHMKLCQLIPAGRSSESSTKKSILKTNPLLLWVWVGLHIFLVRFSNSRLCVDQLFVLMFILIGQILGWQSWWRQMEVNVGVCKYSTLLCLLIGIFIFKNNDLIMLRIIQEKAPYVSKAEKRKIEYEKKLKAYNKGQVIELKHCFFFLVTFLIASHFVHIFFVCINIRLKDPRKKRNLRSRCLKWMMRTKKMRMAVERLVGRWIVIVDWIHGVVYAPAFILTLQLLNSCRKKMMSRKGQRRIA